MISISPDVKTTDSLLLWFMGFFAKNFKSHAIVKGGMVLRLMHSPRATNDLDVLFVPFTSKKQVVPQIKTILDEVNGIESSVIADSKCIRCLIKYGKLQIQIEGSIAEACEYESVSMSELGVPIILAVQRRDIALANKIAAWNERHLMRDLYDIYFFVSVLQVKPNLETLQSRLKNVYSGRTNKSKSMDIQALVHAIEEAAMNISSKSLNDELGAVLHVNELAGLDLRIKVALNRLAEHLKGC
ncbi:MAG TPA: nucleotidyl transferase AbiEii/AbiGii toxin family protein [Fibrobacteraceae bacterium]|nr:nucleotidyl transferase AbiEii/AbiGii toxin family protein [Fibrobacteraceae bacterium]